MARRVQRRLHPAEAISLALAMTLMTGCTTHHDDPQAMMRDARAALARNDWHAAGLRLRGVTGDAGTDPQLQLLAATVALEQGDANQASALLTTLASTRSAALPAADAATVRKLLARALLAQGNTAGALALVGKDDPADPVSAAVKIRVLAQNGNGPQAVALLDHALARWPHSPDLLLIDGLRQVAAGDTARADAIARDLTAHAPGDYDGAIFAGQRALANHDLAQAAAHFDHAHALRPNHEVALLGLADVARLRGDTKAEHDWIERARRVASTSTPVAVYAAERALAAGHADEAAQIVAPLADKPQADNALRLVAGLAYAQVGRREAAIDQLSAFLQHGGDDSRARFALAVLLSQRGDNAGAWRVLKPLTPAANLGADPLRLAAALASANHDPLSAALATRAAAAASPDPDAAAMRDAAAAIDHQQWARADAIYARLLSEPAPRTPARQVVLSNNAAVVKTALGQPAAAVPLARRALALAPGDPLVMDTLGWALANSGGAKAEALDLLRKATVALPSNATVRGHLMTVLRG